MPALTGEGVSVTGAANSGEGLSLPGGASLGGGGGAGFILSVADVAGVFSGKYEPGGGFGAIDPADFEGVHIYNVITNKGGGSIYVFNLNFGATGVSQVGAATEITLSLPGQDPVVCTWNGNLYESPREDAQALYLISEEGNDIPIGLAITA